jgi:hypothetical protein
MDYGRSFVNTRYSTVSPFKRVRHKEPISIIVRTLENKRMQFDGLDPATTIQAIKLLIQARHSVPAALQWLGLSGKPLDDQKTLDHCGITDNTVVDFTVRSRKTMLYLILGQPYWSGHSWRYTYKSTQGIKVRLALDHALDISILHPSIKPVSGDYVQSVTWSVDLQSDGTLLEHNSGNQVTYLSWDGL